VLEGEVPAESRKAFAVRIKASANAAKGTHIVALDATIDGHRYGERFDFILGVGDDGGEKAGPPKN
jgi:hypothetical protein